MPGVSSLFDEAAVLAAASAVDGLDDFGDEPFREPLGVLLASYAEAPIHELGARILHGSVVRSLANRLRARHWLAIHPEIADEVIEAPLVVVGMMRSGTTLIQRLLASDPRHYCTMGFESLEPAPRLGVSSDQVDPRIGDAEAREKMTRELAPEYFSIHPSYATQAEEEIMFLADAFLSHVPEASCDVPAYREWIDRQDFTPAYRHLRRTLQLLQWEKRRRGQRRHARAPVRLGVHTGLPGSRALRRHGAFHCRAQGGLRGGVRHRSRSTVDLSACAGGRRQCADQEPFAGCLPGAVLVTRRRPR